MGEMRRTEEGARDSGPERVSALVPYCCCPVAADGPVVAGGVAWLAGPSLFALGGRPLRERVREGGGGVSKLSSSRGRERLASDGGRSRPRRDPSRPRARAGGRAGGLAGPRGRSFRRRIHAREALVEGCVWLSRQASLPRRPGQADGREGALRPVPCAWISPGEQQQQGAEGRVGFQQEGGKRSTRSHVSVSAAGSGGPGSTVAASLAPLGPEPLDPQPLALALGVDDGRGEARRVVPRAAWRFARRVWPPFGERPLDACLSRPEAGGGCDPLGQDPPSSPARGRSRLAPASPPPLLSGPGAGFRASRVGRRRTRRAAEGRGRRRRGGGNELPAA